MSLSTLDRIADCGPCQRDNKTKLSSFWCVECNEGLCMACKKAHSLLKTTGDHHLLENVRTRSDSISLADISDLQKCKVHNESAIEKFCNNHSTLCCSRCVEEFHTTCKDLETVSDAAKNSDMPKSCESVISRINKLLISLTAVKKDKEENVASFRNSDRDVKHKIDSARNEVLAKVREIAESLIKISHDLLESNLLLLNENLKCVVAKIEELDRKKKQMQLFFEKGSCEHTFLLLRKLKSELASDENYVREEIETSKNQIIHFESNTQEITSLISDCLGKVLIKTEPSELPLELSEKIPTMDEKDDESVPVHDAGQSVMSLEKSSDFEIDTDGFISGLRATGDDLIALCIRGSNKLLLFSLEGKPKGEITVGGNPFNVTRVPGTDKVVVALPDTAQLQFVDTDLQAAENVINLPEKCWSVTVIKNKLLIAGGEKCLHVLDVKGEKLEEISKPERGRTYSLSFMGDKFVYCSDLDCKNGAVYSITDDGKPIFKYENTILKTPMEVTTDKRGNIYICDLDSNNIQRYSEAGDLIDVPVKGDDVVEPRSICFTKDKTHLVISNNNGKSVFVYKCTFKRNEIQTDIEKETDD